MGSGHKNERKEFGIMTKFPLDLLYIKHILSVIIAENSQQRPERCHIIGHIESNRFKRFHLAISFTSSHLISSIFVKGQMDLNMKKFFHFHVLGNEKQKTFRKLTHALLLTMNYFLLCVVVGGARSYCLVLLGVVCKH
uniref:Uncharacterized protein n=1 Tax=Glossina brevipalpis TaxID=37001 RepID=A0A1A9WBR4_9MUSC